MYRPKEFPVQYFLAQIRLRPVKYQQTPTVSTEQEGEKERGTGEVCCEGGKGNMGRGERLPQSPLRSALPCLGFL